MIDGRPVKVFINNTIHSIILKWVKQHFVIDYVNLDKSNIYTDLLCE